MIPFDLEANIRAGPPASDESPRPLMSNAALVSYIALC